MGAAACDAALLVEGTELRAHRCVLVARSDYFRLLFLGEFSGALHIHLGVVEAQLEEVGSTTAVLWFFLGIALHDR